MGNLHTEIRKKRLQIIKSWINLLKEKDLEIDREKLIRQAMIEFGTTRRTTKEYVDLCLMTL